MKTQANYSSFEALDIRVGKVTKVEDTTSKKPTYRMTIDFGSEIGIKISCGAYRNYTKEDLVGKQVICVVNFPEKKIGTEISQTLTLGVANSKGEVIYLTPQSEVPLGTQVF
jgi:tRNA-binding protein